MIPDQVESQPKKSMNKNDLNKLILKIFLKENEFHVYQADTNEVCIYRGDSAKDSK